MDETTTIPAPRARATVERLHAAMARVIVGKGDVLEQVLVALLARGHVLLEDLPGLGKTTLAYALARGVGGIFQRIQFTSDLLPSDILGVSVYEERARRFVFQPGPVFGNLILADEINRATPKTQSALLEAMERGKVTVDGHTHDLGSPFMVLATQNPLDYEGTFPLPESQLDRFLLRLEMGYPQAADELEILRRGWRHYDALALEPVIELQELETLQQWVDQVYLEESVLEYLLRLVTATRTEAEFRAGISTRGALALKQAAQASALLRGRSFVLPDDVVRLALPVLAHRLSLRRAAETALAERRQIEALLRQMIDRIPLPL